MRSLLTILLVLTIFTGCSNTPKKAQVQGSDSLIAPAIQVQSEAPIGAPEAVLTTSESEVIHFSNLEIKVFKNSPPNDGYGYDIIKPGGGGVHQPQIPGMPGNHGFSSEEKARKTAEFVRSKMENNNSRPSVSKAELDSLGVLK